MGTFIYFLLLSSSYLYFCLCENHNSRTVGAQIGTPGDELTTSDNGKTINEEEQLNQFLMEILHKKQQRCEPLTISICGKLGYSQTFSTKKTWYTDLKLEDLPVAKCSEDMLFLFCMTFNPICFENYNNVVLPCKSVCTKVKGECSAAFEESFIEWPTEFDCDKLPEYDSDVCIKPDSIVGYKKDAEIKKIDSECSSCLEPTKPERSHYDSSDYVIEATLLSMTQKKQRLKLKFKLNRIFKQGKKIIVRHKTLKLYTKSLCSCPRFQIEKKYLIFGVENEAEKRLLIDSNSIIIESTSPWKRLIRQWKIKSQRFSKNKLDSKNYSHVYSNIHIIKTKGIPFT